MNSLSRPIVLASVIGFALSGFALRDPIGANLDRIQIIEGWLEDGETREKVYVMVWSGGRAGEHKGARVHVAGVVRPGGVMGGTAKRAHERRHPR